MQLDPNIGGKSVTSGGDSVMVGPNKQDMWQQGRGMGDVGISGGGRKYKGRDGVWGGRKTLG